MRTCLKPLVLVALCSIIDVSLLASTTSPVELPNATSVVRSDVYLLS